MKYLIKGAHIIDPANNFDAVADILVEDGRIAKVEKNIKTDAEVIDANGLTCVPGLIDLHVHLREPGYEGKETISTGSMSAAKGGFTTVCMMPNTNPAMDTKEHVEQANEIIKTDALVNVKVIGAITKERKGGEITDFKELKAAGAVALSDDGSPVWDLDVMKAALKYAYNFGLPITSHAEDLELAKNGVMNDGFISSKLGLTGISNASEYEAVKREIDLVRETATALHFSHISTKESCELIAAAKKEGLRITAEATPHHFTLTEKECESFSGNTKMNPPLRTATDVEAVKKALADGTLDAIATDHAPHAPHEKEVEFDLAMFGIIGLETSFALSYETLVLSGLIDLKKLVELMSVNPASIFKLNGGSLAVGQVADITLIDLNKKWVYTKEEILSSSSNTPYIGRELTGCVEHVLVGGKHIFAEGKINE
ncbi:dihydroorotase [Elusimicrobium simillimum]|uniref:dihydroorotase n=1 Tax=Elusimicrobium simillimum TaxID=3143438 RepID=UPI003C6F4949